MHKWVKILLWLAGALAVLLLVLMFVVPEIGRRQAVAWFAAHTERTLSIDGLAFNPLKLTAELRGVDLSEPGGKESFAAFDLLRIRLSPRSLRALTPIVEEVQLLRPRVRIERLDANTYNFSDLQRLGGAEPKPKPESEPEEKGPPPKFSLNNLVLAGGSVDFIDHLPSGEVQTHQVRDLELSVPAVGNLPYMAESYVQPRISARVNDAPFALDARLKPFAEHLEATAEINLDALELPRYLDYVPGKLPVAIPSGNLTTELSVLYRVAADKAPELQLGGNLTLTSLKLLDGSGQPLAFLPYTQVEFAPSDLLASRVSLSALRIYRPEIHIHRDGSGVLNLARLGSPEKKQQTEELEPAQKEQKAPLDFLLSSLRLREGVVHFFDEMPAGGFKSEVRQIDLDVDGFRLGGTNPAKFDLGFVTGRDERGKASGEVLPEPLKVKVELALTSIPLEAYYPYVEPFLASPVRGSLGASASLSFDAKAGAVVQNGKVKLQGLKADFGGGEGVEMDRIALDGAAWSRAGLELGNLALGKGALQVSRLPDGSISALGLLRPAPEKTKAQAAPEPSGEKKSRPLSYRVGKVSLEDLDLVFRDRTLPEEARIDIDRLAFSFENIAGPPQGLSPLTFSARVGRVGDVRLKGKLDLARPSLRGALSTRGLPLSEFVPYIRPHVNIELADGRFDTDLLAYLDFGSSQPRGDFSGELGLRRFHALDAGDEDLLRWESLQLEGIKGKIAPFALEIKDVSLTNYLAKVVIAADGSLNLQHLTKERPAARAEPAAAAPAPEAAASSPPPVISIGALTLQGGTLNFADRHMPREFATTMYNLGGRVGGISSLSAEPAEVDLRGNLENHSPLSITGRINPLGEKLFADLRIAFTDIELTAISPYTGTYLGYLVSKGKLHLDLDYKIDGTLLEAGNKVFLDQFTLGSRVESEKATSLPVKLAIALLKDGKGEIHLDLPITGRTDDPQFSVFSVVLKILKNLLVKAATSPFKLLAAAFGGSGDFSTLAFASGSASMDAAQKQSLSKLVEALRDRPALKLEVSGYVDRDKDPEGYRNVLLEQKMRKLRYVELLKKKELPEGATAETLEIPPKAYSDYLWEVYKQEDFAKPRNVMGMIKHLEDGEMKKLIFTHTPVGEKEFADLAAARVEAVRAFLTQEAGLAPERIFLKQDDIYRGPGEGPASRVEFGMGVD